MEFSEDPKDVQISFAIIVSAGNAKTEAYAALRSARDGDFEKAEEHLKNSEKEIVEGHKAQTKLLSQEAGGEKVPISMLLLHAQDTLMTTMSECNLIEEMIALYRRLSDAKL
jgi:PTS system cellobiose-specific IIA component